MDSSSSRKDPEQICEVEILSKNVGDDHHGNFEVCKASFTDVSTFAASPDIVVIIHINIEDHFFVRWNERFLVTRIMSIRWNVVHRAYIDFVWHPADKSLLELLSCLKAKIAAVDIIRKSKGKLSVVEVL